MMDAKLKAEWVKALRSGEYRQGQAEFESASGDQFCCLGVLCKVAGVPTTINATGNWRFAQRMMAHEEVWKLVGMNDSDATFWQIADYIEANL